MDLLSKYKLQLMGVAIIWILLYHSGLNYGIVSPIISIGYGGVDIFFFLSGIGLYYSYTKNNNIIQFYIRRVERIMPTYIIVVLISMICLGIFSFPKYLFYISTLGFWVSGGFFEWYVPSILMFYFLFPFFIKQFNKSPNKTILFVLLGTFILIGIRIWCNKGEHLMLFLTRIPIFCLGIIFGKYIYTNTYPKFITNRNLYIISLISLLLLIYFNIYFKPYLWKWGLHWLPFIGIVPGLCIFFTSILNKVNIKFINMLFSFLGGLSLEIYLIHIKAFEKSIQLSEHFQTSKFTIILIIILLTVPSAYVLAKFANLLLSLITTRSTVKK